MISRLISRGLPTPSLDFFVPWEASKNPDESNPFYDPFCIPEIGSNRFHPEIIHRFPIRFPPSCRCPLREVQRLGREILNVSAMFFVCFFLVCFWENKHFDVSSRIFVYTETRLSISSTCIQDTGSKFSCMKICSNGSEDPHQDVL